MIISSTQVDTKTLLKVDKKSYKEAVEEIADCNSKFNLEIAVIGLRFLLHTPILTFSARLEEKGGRNKPRKFSSGKWFPVKLDGKLIKTTSKFYIWLTMDMLL